MDADTGEVLHLENPGTAVECCFPPGSLVKVFSALYGLKTNLISPSVTVRCGGSLLVEEEKLDCWLRKGHGTVNFYKALAYSCNVYFYRWGRGVDAGGFLEFLRSMGFGKKTGIDLPNENAGEVPGVLDPVETAKVFTGSSRQLRITPIQAITAFAAVVNGGKLLKPLLCLRRPGAPWQGEPIYGHTEAIRSLVFCQTGRIFNRLPAPRGPGPPKNFLLRKTIIREDLNLAGHLPLLHRALREASTYGTSSGYFQAIGGFAKTGTAPWTKGYHTHAWFAGYLPLPNRRIVLLVFIPAGQGAKDALPIGLKLAKTIKEKLTDNQRVTVSLYSLLKPKTVIIRGRFGSLTVKDNETETRCREIDIRHGSRGGINVWVDGKETGFHEKIEIRGPGPKGFLNVEVKGIENRNYHGDFVVRSNGDYLDICCTLSLREYLEGVIGNEMGESLEALKAQAILSRTYALRNPGRHGEFDFCDTTHCQHYKSPRKLSEVVRRAVKETLGMVLTYDGELCDVYYHSTCGGVTNDFKGVWGGEGVPYLGSIDCGGKCRVSPHYRWEFRIERGELFGVMEGVVGSVPRDFRSVETGEGGWVKGLSIVLDDGREEVLGGEAFHILMGRRFGWGGIKSANFVIERGGKYWVFSGRGLGHGVGLCQWGAWVLAESGLGFREILNVYFPGVRLSSSDFPAPGFYK